MLSTLLAAALTLVPAADYPRTDLLVEAPNLAKKLDGVRVLDVRGKNLYLAGHIPGAVWVDAAAWNKAFATPDAKAWSALLAGVGVAPDSAIVVCGADDVRDAARVWWILKYWDAKDVRLLNGGWSAWKATGAATATDDVKAESNPVALTAKAERLTTKAQLLDSLKGEAPQLVDSRSKDEHCGVMETAQRNGAIPGSIHLEWTDTIDAKTRKFKAADELAAILKERKIDVNRPTVTYCQSGGRAAVMAFALELMGGKQVGNYYKSWSEWGNDEATPVVKPPK